MPAGPAVTVEAEANRCRVNGDRLSAAPAEIGAVFVTTSFLIRFVISFKASIMILGAQGNRPAAPSALGKYWAPLCGRETLAQKGGLE